MAIEKYEVRNHFTGDVQFTAEIDVTESMMPRVKLGLAVKWARNNGVNLSDADLSGADLRGVNLSGADLSCADLSGADLSGAYLRDADLSGADLRDADLSGVNLRGVNLRGVNLRGVNLRFIEADFRFIMSKAHTEVLLLIAALKEGRVNGSTYDGDCACLVGTLENAGASLPHDLHNSPAEQWFWSIRKGDVPNSDTEGGFRAKMALEWAESYCRDTGIEVSA